MLDEPGAEATGAGRAASIAGGGMAGALGVAGLLGVAATPSMAAEAHVQGAGFHRASRKASVGQ